MQDPLHEVSLVGSKISLSWKIFVKRVSFEPRVKD